jgi:ABC-type branched-subunit amino acid transport system substrate-binding protein
VPPRNGCQALHDADGRRGLRCDQRPGPRRRSVKVGFSIALTGGIAPIGRPLLAAVELWRDDANAKGGLLDRPVQLVFYDDQSNPSNLPGIYTKLLSVDRWTCCSVPMAPTWSPPRCLSS